MRLSAADATGVRDYCSKVFDFKTLQVKRFATWHARHEHRKKIVQARNTHNLVSHRGSTQFMPDDIY